MKKLYRYLIACSIAILLVPALSFAGNKDRAGEAGGSSLLINPWAGSSGWGGANVSTVKGLESTYNNVAGLAFTNKTDIGINHSMWLKGSDISLLDFGIGVRVSETGVIGFNVMSMNMGDIEYTTVDLPDGGIGTFSPTYLNVGVSYAKAFSNSIYGGAQLKIVSEGIANATATGIALDAGIQYIAGDLENIHFGISLRNWGPKMKYSGDGYSQQSTIGVRDNQFTTEQRGSSFELPAQLNIGAAYDILFSDVTYLTVAGTFSSNAFKRDQVILGLEFSYKNVLILRTGYNDLGKAFNMGKALVNPTDENENLVDEAYKSSAFTGPSGGFSFRVPLNKELGSYVSIDASYRATQHFSGVTTLGARIAF